MKTKLLTAVEPAYVAFFMEDLRLLLADEHQGLVQAASSWLTAFLAAGSDTEREKLLAQVAQSAKAKPETAKKVFGMLAFIAPRISHPGDHETFIEDFSGDVQTLLAEQNLSPLAKNELNRLHELLSGLAPRAAEFKRSLSVSQLKRGVLPMYERIDATVEMRALESPLLSEAEHEFAPLELLPLASVQVILDSGQPSEICFQITEHDLGDLLKKLQQLQTAMARLKERVSMQKEKTE